MAVATEKWSMPPPWKSILVLLCAHAIPRTGVVEASKHHLEVRNNICPYIPLNTFEFSTTGHLDVKLSNFSHDHVNEDDLFGLSLDKITIDQMIPYLDSHQDECIEQPSNIQRTGPLLFFLLDLKNLQVQVSCSPEWKNSQERKERSFFPMYRGKRQSFTKVSDSSIFMQLHKHGLPVEEEKVNDDIHQLPVVSAVKTSKPVMAATAPVSQLTESQPKLHQSNENAAAAAGQESAVISSAENLSLNQLCSNYILPLTKTVVDGKSYYNMSFSMLVNFVSDEDLYIQVAFHAIPNYHELRPVSFNIDIEENNNVNYLLADKMSLPTLYCMMSLLFFFSGLYWVFILEKRCHNVVEIHNIMTVVVFLKTLSLVLHSINYHFTETSDEHVKTWTVVYYIVHLLKDFVLFRTIMLIGTGWSLIKRELSNKDKKLFMIVIPIQVLANIAAIIIYESEDSDIEFLMWRNIFNIVDLLCYGAILFPIVWSMRHLRHLFEASTINDEAEIYLRKHKLFSDFYIMTLLYIFLTRFIKFTVNFQNAWLEEMLHEMATYVFFVLTGYKFRPDSSPPYV